MDCYIFICYIEEVNFFNVQKVLARCPVPGAQCLTYVPKNDKDIDKPRQPGLCNRPLEIENVTNTFVGNLFLLSFIKYG